MVSAEAASDPATARTGGDRDRRDERDLCAHALYGGTSGTALFYAALYAARGDAMWADAARGLMDGTRRWLDAIDDKDGRRMPHSAPHALGGGGGLGIGITGGIGSFVYTQMLLAGLLRDPAQLELAWQAARAIGRARIIADARFDVTDGAAGAAIALVALSREDPSRAHAHALDDRLAACGDHLVATQVPRAVGGAWPARHGGFHIGFAHGAAGIGWALALVYSRLGDDRYRQAALRAFAFVQSQFASAQTNWPVLELDGPAAPLVPTWMHAWCHGAPGIALAKALTRRDAPDLAQAIVLTDTHGGASTATAAPTDHLCCGAAGQAELQLTLGQLAATDGQAVAAAVSDSNSAAGLRSNAVAGLESGAAVDASVKARTMIAGVLARARARGHFRLAASGAEYPIVTPGFFQGLAGIGYTLLRLADPQALPSVLAFDTSAATRALPIARQTPREHRNANEPVRS
jgi:lantibiotic modifying enzyme